MPPKSSKRPAKTSSQPPLSNSSTPSPFTALPPALEPLVSTLDSNHLYITHVDTHPSPFKRRIFLVPIFLNVLIVVGLVYRLWTAIPVYFDILVATFGYDNALKVHIKDTPWGSLAGTVVGRAGLFMLDYFLATIILPWPVDFFLGSNNNPTSPAYWRWTCGFRDKEVVVRRSRRWDEAFRQRDWTSSGDFVEKDDNGIMSERLRPAVKPRWLSEKTGYLMMNKDWDLHFGGMVDAHELLTEKMAILEDFSTKVIVHDKEKGWVVWDVNGEERRATVPLDMYS